MVDKFRYAKMNTVRRNLVRGPENVGFHDYVERTVLSCRQEILCQFLTLGDGHAVYRDSTSAYLSRSTHTDVW